MINVLNNKKFNESYSAINIPFDDAHYVDRAEAVIKEMKNKNFKYGKDQLTTNQIRNLLSLTSTIYDELQQKSISEISDQIAYLRIKFIYQSGRNEAVKALIELAGILGLLKQIQNANDSKMMLRFCRYMEALVAYFKYYGGKD